MASTARFLGTRVDPRAKRAFLAALRVQLDAGMSVLTSLSKLAEFGPSAVAQNASQSMSDNVRHGATLSEAAAACPVMFSSFDVATLQAAEQTGHLCDALIAIEQDVGWRLEVGASLRRALLLPFFILNVGFLAFNVPALLGPTWFVVIAEWILLNSVLIAIAILVFRSQHLGGLRHAIDSLLIELPPLSRMFGRALIGHQKALFFGGAARIVDSGAPLVAGFEIIARQLGSPVVREDLASIASRLRVGDGVADAFHSCRFIAAQEVAMIDSGERAGELAAALKTLAGLCRDDFEGWLIKFSRLLPLALYLSAGAYVLLRLL